jgi:hypothetical protein
MNELTQEEKNYITAALHFYKHSMYTSSNTNSGTRIAAELNDFNVKAKLYLLKPINEGGK